MSKKYQIRVSLYKNVTKEEAYELSESILADRDDLVRAARVYKWIPNKKTVRTQPKTEIAILSNPDSKFRRYFEAKLKSMQFGEATTIAETMEAFDIINSKLGTNL